MRIQELQWNQMKIHYEFAWKWKQMNLNEKLLVLLNQVKYFEADLKKENS